MSTVQCPELTASYAVSLLCCQLNIGHVDSNGVYTGQYTPLALSGFVRGMAESDHSLNRLAAEQGLMRDINSFPKQHKFHKEQ